MTANVEMFSEEKKTIVGNFRGVLKIKILPQIYWDYTDLQRWCEYRIIGGTNN